MSQRASDIFTLQLSVVALKHQKIDSPNSSSKAASEYKPTSNFMPSGHNYPILFVIKDETLCRL